MSPTSPSLTVDIAGVRCRVHVTSLAWLAMLQARYAAFLTQSDPRWHVFLTYEPGEEDPSRVWVAHEATVTRFEVWPSRGVIDLATQRAQVGVSYADYLEAAADPVLSFILMHELPKSRLGLMLHGAGIVRNGHGLAFSGRSGVGKTTSSRLAGGFGDVLTDENLAILLRCPQPVLASTPFWGGSTPPELICRVNRQVPLRAVLLLEHGPEFQLASLTPGEAAMALLSTEKIGVERVSSADAWLDMVEELVAAVPTYRLYFRPTVELWPFLDRQLNL